MTTQTVFDELMVLMDGSVAIARRKRSERNARAYAWTAEVLITLMCLPMFKDVEV